MEIVSCKDETAWVEAANTWLAHQVATRPISCLFLPAGETPRPLYRSWEKNGAPFDKKVQLIQVDEIISGSGCGQFRNFFIETLPSFQKQFQYIDLAEQGADLAILGLGTNGHVAFHEPSLPIHFYSGCLNLDADTTERLKISKDSRAVSYGLDAFLKTKALLLIVRGVSKKNILREILLPSCQLPAAGLKTHSQLTVLTDFALT